MRGALERAGGILGLALATTTVAVGVVLVTRTLDERTARETYLHRVAELCASYGQELDLIAPPDIAIPASVYESVSKALPVLEAELEDVQAIRPPHSLRSDVSRFLELTGRTITELRRVRAEALDRDLFGAKTALDRFGEVRDRAQLLGRQVGFTC